MEGFGSVQIIMDSDLGAPKTDGSYRSGSGTLRFFFTINLIAKNLFTTLRGGFITYF
jgi:hypothetical protein